ncbi:MAG: helix-turn-helix domain-containing protein [Oscillospiraceae bacterium]|jgi:two-component system response regulator YesN|nr:helix-turn-helix domain-containing protein [Oscillospiraceae bacterium]
MSDSKISLLIAEDEERVRGSLKSFISKNADYVSEIYCAANGQEAIDIIIQYNPDVMLLDIKMPIKSGIDVMKEASAIGILPKTIVISSYDKFEYAQLALRYGAMEYLLKPTATSDILRAIWSVYKREPPRGNEQKKSAVLNSFISNALDYMNRHYPDELTLTIVAEHIGITPNYLSTLFKRTLGCGFIDCLNQIRVERACDYFVDNKMKTYEVAYKVGYRDEKYFSTVFKKTKGMSPSEYRKNHKG